MLGLTIDLSLPAPAWSQIVDGILDRVAGGDLGGGEQLPSVRRLAADLRLNPNTIARAYRELEVLGAVRGRAGRGVFVTDRGASIARRARRVAIRKLLKDAVQRAVVAGLTAEQVRDVIEGSLRRTAGDAKAKAKAKEEQG